ncbi:dihydrodipicolinate synthase family protein [Kosmotoga sp. DU53]|uniref:dihydrodipicolinate synthase family protein n=1 Tax=Kosmotoga sp. DU53 TaxID=1310160 RepID=UPI00129021AC|nr:dihydrodipicolinate synthase family protein [Kosmotoga sp. DU53]
MRELDGKLFPAVPTLFNKKTREIDEQANRNFAMYLKETPIDGVAVWVHTGRGLFLSQIERRFILKLWREALPEKTIIAGVGSNKKLGRDDIKAYIEECLMMAEEAKSGGADCLLAFPPVPLKKLSEDDDLIVRYHRELAQIGLPVILFYLYEEAGGISYSYETLEKLLSMDHVVGIKLATLYSVIKMQDISRFVLEKFPGKALITGEDRMFGYSLTRGSRSALIGLGSVLPSLQKDLIESYLKKDPAFVSLMEKVDLLAEALFVEPMEGYIERVEEALAMMNIIPEDCVFDPYGPGISDTDKERIRKTLEQLGAL